MLSWIALGLLAAARVLFLNWRHHRRIGGFPGSPAILGSAEVLIAGEILGAIADTYFEDWQGISLRKSALHSSPPAQQSERIRPEALLCTSLLKQHMKSLPVLPSRIVQGAPATTPSLNPPT